MSPIRQRKNKKQEKQPQSNSGHNNRDAGASTNEKASKNNNNTKANNKKKTKNKMENGVTSSNSNSSSRPMRAKASWIVVFVVSVVGIVLTTVLVTSPWKSSDMTDGHHNDEVEQVQQQNQRMLYTEFRNSFEVVQSIPHDPRAFTQGLQFDPHNPNILYESNGMYGESDMRVYDFPSMEIRNKLELESRFFGEGCTVFYQKESRRLRRNIEPAKVDRQVDGDENEEEGEDPEVVLDDESQESVVVEMKKRIIQLTWREQTGFIYDIEPSGGLQLIRQFEYETTNTQGWGITYNPNNHTLIVTDGSQYLHIWDADTLSEIERIEVKFQRNDMTSSQSTNNINELEYDESTQTILTNIWQTDLIVRMDPATGFISTVYDLKDLYVNRAYSADVLNGIALRKVTEDDDELWVTGKYWPTLYQIRLL